MTEDEAKNLWCYYQDSCPNTEGTSCIGSRCMFWRWSVVPKPSLPMCSINPRAMETIDRWTNPEVIGDGYCGRAGKP